MPAKKPNQPNKPKPPRSPGKKPKTALRIEFEKQLKRIERAEKKLLKEGYIIEKPDYKGRTEYKRITKQAIERLKQIKPKTIRAAAIHETKPGSGEYVKGTEYYKTQQAIKRAGNLQIRKMISEKIDEWGSLDPNPQHQSVYLQDALKNVGNKFLRENEQYIMLTLSKMIRMYPSVPKEALQQGTELLSMFYSATTKMSTDEKIENIILSEDYPEEFENGDWY